VGKMTETNEEELQIAIERNLDNVADGKPLDTPLSVLNGMFKKKYKEETEKFYQKARHKTDKYKAYQKAYHQTPKYKAYLKAYRQTPKYKAYQKAYYQKKKLQKEKSK